jgi:hypothetical protein
MNVIRAGVMRLNSRRRAIAASVARTGWPIMLLGLLTA